MGCRCCGGGWSGYVLMSDVLGGGLGWIFVVVFFSSSSKRWLGLDLIGEATVWL